MPPYLGRLTSPSLKALNVTLYFTLAVTIQTAESKKMYVFNEPETDVLQCPAVHLSQGFYSIISREFL